MYEVGRRYVSQFAPTPRKIIDISPCSGKQQCSKGRICPGRVTFESDPMFGRCGFTVSGPTYKLAETKLSRHINKIKSLT